MSEAKAKSDLKKMLGDMAADKITLHLDVSPSQAMELIKLYEDLKRRELD